jgi:CRP/FNR family transcriptional regulator, cyclic AMP receptor protein
LPEIMTLIPASERQLVEQVLHVPRLQVDGDLADTLTATPTAFDFIVADGVVLKQTRYAGRNSLELLGPGDVLAPPLTPSRQLESRAISSYQAHGEASLAVIEDRFRTAARRWPQLSDVLHDRLARQTHRASMHLAMLHIARAKDRVLALFSDLADRFGHVTSYGIVIGVELTHKLIGQLIGSRRSTVSLALEELSMTGALTRTRNDRWMLNAPDILG